MNSKHSAACISIVIPVYNAEGSIARLVDALIDAVGPLYKLEIMLVNDHSADNSEQACIALFYKYPDTVKFFSLAKNVGEHNAVMAGLNQSQGDYVVIMDDDFQNPISEVLKLISHATSHDCDVTFSYYKRKKHAFYRNLGSWFNDKVANIMLQKPRGLYLSSFKILNRFIVNEIIKYDSSFPYIDGLILRATSNFGTVEVEHHKREFGKSGYTLRKLIRLWLNMFTSFSILPLRVATVFGFVFSFIGLLFGVVTILEKLINPNVPLGYTTIIVILLLFAGVQLISLGVIGEYVGRIFFSQNKAPQYTIRKRYEKESPDKR